MKLLENKVIIVTGATAGIGRAAVELFTQHGASVVATARRAEQLDELVHQVTSSGGSATAVVGDVANESHASEAVAAALEHFGALHGALNNAGTIGDACPTVKLPLSSWQTVIATNLTGAYLGAKHQIPAILESGGGSVVFTSSFVGTTVGFPGLAAYAASKAGLGGLTKALAAEVGPNGVRVYALLPGGTDTSMMANSFAGTPEAKAGVEGMHALKRIARPAEIASSALYLLSDLSSFVTGETHLADGGVSVNRS